MKVLMISGDPNVFDPRKEAYERMRRYRKALGELYILVPAGSVLVRLFSLYFQGVKFCKRHAFDFITAQGPDELGLVAYLISRRFGIPFQLQIHTDIFSPWYRRAGRKERIRYNLAKFLIPRADCLRVVSERIKESILRKSDFLKEVRLPKVVVLPIFTDVSQFVSAVSDPTADARFKDYSFKMIAVGRFVDKEKNFSMLIEMMAGFIKICPKALLVLVGDGPDRENYKLQITNYKLEKNVILEPWRDYFPSFYRSFDLYLLSSNYEGWGRTVIEAMASGLPVVMTDVGLAKEVVVHEKHGLVVPVGDKKAVFDACRYLYTNPDKRTVLASAGQERVRELFSGTAENYFEKYRESFQLCL